MSDEIGEIVEVQPRNVANYALAEIYASVSRIVDPSYAISGI